MKIAEALVARAARGYIGGTDAGSAIETCRSLDASRFTLGFWNPRGMHPGEVAQRLAEASCSIDTNSLDARLAVKAPALGFSGERIAGIARAAGTDLHLDSHGIEAQDATLALAHAGLGVTIPSRWRRSVLDARVAAANGLAVRVVKGQFPGAPADECDPRVNFLRILEALRGAPKVFVATHDCALLTLALDALLERGALCEVELLHGLPQRRAREIADARGVPVRIYVPFGAAFLPYALGSLRKEPWRIAWLLRDALRV